MAEHEPSVGTDDLLRTATAWLAAEPDADMRIELSSLIAAAEAGDDAELADRFAGRLQFGTAGLRAAVAAGSMRMNRLVVRQAAAGLGRWLLDAEASGEIPDAARRGVVIAHDARRKSDLFADDTARVLAAMGIRSMLHPGVQPTPVLAWSITGANAAAGVVVTASHNPPADNGYKVYLEAGSQIVAPIDTDIADRIGRFDPLTVELAPGDDPLIERSRRLLGRPVRRVRAVGATASRCSRRLGGIHGDARSRWRGRVAGLRSGGVPCPVRGRSAAGARRHVPDRVVPEPGGAGSDGSPARRSARRVAQGLRSRTIPMPTGSAWRFLSRTDRGGG